MASIKINGDTSGSTTISAPATGSDETIELSTALASKLDLAGGKILQIVRATDSTSRSTTSTSFVDATISVTITPQKSDSAIILLWIAMISPTIGVSGAASRVYVQITDASNNAISGAEEGRFGSFDLNTTGTVSLPVKIVGYATPATTSAVTYKGRYKSENGVAAALNNGFLTGQLYAIEVSA